MKIPERNLNPPPDDYEECPDCEGEGQRSVVTRCGYDYQICPRCHGDGVVSKAEEREAIAADIADREHDRREDDKLRDEEEK